MARYSDTLRDALTQAPIEGAYVSVLANGTDDTASLTNDDGQAMANPLQTDVFGSVVFNASPSYYDLEYHYGGRMARKDYNVPVLDGGGVGPTDTLIGFDEDGNLEFIPIEDFKGASGAPGGNAMSIGLGKDIHLLNLATGTPASFNAFRTEGFYAVGDGGEAWYWRNPGAALPGDQVTGDGVRLSLSLSQQLTFEMLGARTTGWIGTGVISGATLTISATQSGAMAIGMTLTAAGGTGAVSAGTVITAGSGTSWTVNNPQTVSSRVMVANDSSPYVAAALQLGRRGMISVGPHWFGQAVVVKDYQANWSGPAGYGVSNVALPATWCFPSGYAGLVVVPGNATVTPQGDVTLSGSQPYGGAVGSFISRINIQVGNGQLPAATVNHRPAIALYVEVALDNFTINGADGNGLYISGNGPTNLADKCLISNFFITQCFDNGIETVGGDANTCVFTNGLVAVTGASSIYEHSFLGNAYRGMQVQDNGQINAFVILSNTIYYSIQDGNLNHPPPDANWWGVGASFTAANNWSSGTTYRVGAGYRTAGGANVSEFISCYSEGSSIPSLFNASSGGQALSTLYGGLLGGGTAGVYNYYTSVSQAYRFSSYRADGVGFQHHVGNSSAVGFSANNLLGNDSGGANARGVFDTGAHGDTYARLTSYLIGTKRVGCLSGFTGTSGAGTEVFMLIWAGADNALWPETDNIFSFGTAAHRWTDVFSRNLRPGAGTVIWTSGAGTPEANVTAPVGSLYTRTDGGAATTLYVKESGAAGNTGWVAK